MTGKTLTVAFLLLLPSLFVFAQDSIGGDFSVSADSNIQICPCSGQGYPVTIVNNGLSTSTYSFFVNEEAASVVDIDPLQVTLSPGEATLAVAFITTACGAEGVLPFSIFVSDSNNAVQELAQNVNVISCYDHSITAGKAVLSEIVDEIHGTPGIEFEPYSGSYTLCSEEETVIPLQVLNKDTLFANNFRASLQGIASASLSATEYSLDPQQAGYLLLTVNPTVSEAKRAPVIVTTVTGMGRVKRVLSLDLDVKQCHTAVLDKITSSPELCVGEEEEFLISVENVGDVQESLSLAIEPSWVTVDPQSFTLQSKQKRELILFVRPIAEEPASEVSIGLVSNTQNRTLDTLTIPVRLLSDNACYSLQIDSERIVSYGEKEFFPVAITNNGDVTSEFSFSIGGQSWVTLDQMLSEIDAGDTHTVNVGVNPRGILPGNYQAWLTVSSDSLNRTVEIPIVVREKNAFVEAVGGFFYFWRYYFYAFIVLVVIVLVLGYILKRRFRKSIKEELEEETLEQEGFKTKEEMGEKADESNGSEENPEDEPFDEKSDENKSAGKVEEPEVSEKKEKPAVTVTKKGNSSVSVRSKRKGKKKAGRRKGKKKVGSTPE